MQLPKTHQKVLDVYHKEGHVKAWNFWKLMGFNYGIFLGEVHCEDFITGEELCNYINLKYGTVHFTDIPWLKFILDGQILYVSKKVIRYGLSWNDIDEVGAVTEAQNCDIIIHGDTYLVTLLRGINDNIEYESRYADDDITKYSEWNRLMYPISKGENGGVSKHTPYHQWAEYTERDLLPSSSLLDMAHTWCQDITFSDVFRIRRGGHYVESISPVDREYALSTCGYRPCLRLIEN